MTQWAGFVRDLGRAVVPAAPVKDLWISAAYTSVQGARALRRLITSSRSSHAILGCNAQTEWQALARLEEWGVQVQLMPDPRGGIFHPKCIYAEGEDGRAWVVAGSANLTAGGFGRNIEAGLKVSGPASLKVIRQAREFFAELAESAAPLTPALLEQFKHAQEEIRQTAAAAEHASMTQMVGLDPGQVMHLTPAGRALVVNVTVHGFFHYITSTRMEASYKMVILALLLQIDTGQLDLIRLACRFAGFYGLLAARSLPPERPGIKMQQVRSLTLKAVQDVLRGAPREALTRSGAVQYTRSYVEVNRQIWAGLNPGDRERARQLATDRLSGYYRDHFGYAADFSQLLLATETAPWPGIGLV